MKPLRNTIWPLLLAFFSNGGWANDLCPPNLKTQQSSSVVPPSYQIAEDTLGPHRLTFVEVYDGPVKEMASLVPDVQKSGESRWVLGQWSEQRGVEVACHYSRTRLILVKRLPKGAKTCVAKYQARSEGLIEGSVQIASFECQ